MNSFDSAFEALALHYVGFGLFTVVNNVWTIVALVTAALSFWRFRSASLPLPPPSDHPLEALGSGPSCSSTPDEAAAMTKKTTSIPEVAAAPSACEGDDAATKGRFVTYYREEDRSDAAVDDVEEEAEVSGDGEVGEWWEGWEKALRLRRNGGERGMGWYEYQDRAVLSGSVVRLWEEQRLGLVVTSEGRYGVVW